MMYSMRFHILGGKAANRYIKWKIIDHDFWRYAQADSNIIVHLDKPGFKKVAPNRLYVEIASGGPFGALLTALANKRRRMIGMFVQIYGIQNEIPCRHCEMRLIKSENGIRHSMIPFFGCVSNARFNTACGNCLIHVKAAKCEFRDNKFACLRASWGRNPSLE
jgi:hypothetical protein